MAIKIKGVEVLSDDQELVGVKFGSDEITFPSADGSNSQVLMTDGSGNLTFSTISTDLVSDTTPQLGGNLDVQSYEISSSTGNVVVNDSFNVKSGSTTLLEVYDAAGVTGISSPSWGMAFAAPDINFNSGTTNPVYINSIQYPTTDGANGQVLTTDGSGNLSFSTRLANVIEDTTPKLGGDLDVNDKIIKGSTGTVFNYPGASLELLRGTTGSSTTATTLLLGNTGNRSGLSGTAYGGNVTIQGGEAIHNSSAGHGGNVVLKGGEGNGTSSSRSGSVIVSDAYNFTVTASNLITLNGKTRASTIELSQNHSFPVAKFVTAYDSSSSTDTFNLASFDQNEIRSMKIVIQASNTTSGYYYVSELLCMHDGTNAYSTEYATIDTTPEDDMISIQVALLNGNFIVKITPTTSDTIQYKFTMQQTFA
jgi:hypothetical protein